MLTTYKEVEAFIRDFEACSLPKARWTHQAHLIAGFWYSGKYESRVALDVMRERIQRHNESVGTANTDTSGYHETITRLYLLAICEHISLHRDVPFAESLARLLASPLGDSAWPLRYYSRERLFSVMARRDWIEPDLRPISGRATREHHRNEADPSNGWNSVASGFIQVRQHSHMGVEAITQWAKDLPPGCDVLDLGCGFGVPLSEALIEQGLQVYGIDASPRLVEEFRKRFPDLHVRCEAVEVSDFYGKTFDGVIAIGLVFLLSKENQLLLIEKVAKSLKSGGKFLFTVPDQVCTWKDLLTGRESASLGRAVYLAACSKVGLGLVTEFSDDGENHHIAAVKQ